MSPLSLARSAKGCTAEASRLFHSSAGLLRCFSSYFVLLFVAGWMTRCDYIGAPVLWVEATDIHEAQMASLELGKASVRELKGGETHSYELPLAAGQLVEVTAEQLGTNVRIILLKPNGAKLVEADSQRGARGVEQAYLLAEAAGRYVLRIKSMRKQAVPGRYRLSVTEPRPATSQDHDRITAQAQQYDIGELDRRKTDVPSWQRAAAAYQAALLTWRALGERRRAADVLNKLSEVFWLMLRPPEAIEYATQARTLYRELGDLSGEANALFALGQAYRLQRDRSLSVEHYEQALRLYRRLGDRYGAGLALYWISPYYNTRGEKWRALACAEEAAQLLRAAGEPGHEGFACLKIGWIYDSLGNKLKALAAYEQARALFRADGQQVLVAGAFNDSGEIYAAQGETAQAQAAYRAALAIFREIGDRHIEAQSGTGRVLLALGKLAELQGDKEQALDYYRQALSAYQVRDGYNGQTDARRHLSAVYRALGEWQKALDQSYQTWLSCRDSGDRNEQAAALDDLAFIHLELGDEQQALSLYEQALALHRSLGDREGEAHKLIYTGIAYNRLGEKRRAIERLKQAIALCQVTGARPREAFALSIIAALYETVGKREQARDSYIHALALSRAIADRHQEASALHNLGWFYFGRGTHQRAVKYQLQAAELYRRIGSSVGEANALRARGRVYGVLGQKQKGIDTIQRAIVLTQRSREPHVEALAFYHLAQLYLDAGRLPEARESLESTLHLVESIRANVVNQELRASYLATTQEYYEAYTDLWMRLYEQNKDDNYASEAFQASERRRARSLLELLTEARAELRQKVAPELVERERSLLQQLSVKAVGLLALKNDQATAVQAAELDRQRNALLLDLQQIRAQIRTANPRYATLIQPLSLAEIQQQVLDPDTLLLEYALGQQRSYLWAVTPTSINSFELPKRAEIEAQARKVFSLLTARAVKRKNETPEQQQARIFAADKQFPAAAAQLSQALLNPVAAQLGNKRLLIVADGALQYIPFAALPEPGPGARVRESQPPAPNSPPLMVGHEIINLPSASTLAVLRRELAGRAPAARAVAVLADPVFSSCDERLNTVALGKFNRPGWCDQMERQRSANGQARTVSWSLALSTALRSAAESGVASPAAGFQRLKFSRQEAEAIAALASASEPRQALDFQASRATALSTELSQYRILHFATHGLVNSLHPELSGLVLSLVDERGNDQDGFLRMHEIYSLKLPAELVTLSACQTALGREISGEGLVGLTRGFMYAGAARVLATLWKVDDEKTASLMKAFYARLLDQNGDWRMTATAALRAAQIEMRSQSASSPPYYWAGFVLQGEYK